MKNAKYYINALHLIPHQEGGYFVQTMLGDINQDGQNSYSSILFLLEKNEVSHFHRLQEDEVWYYHDGNALNIYEITEEGKLIITTLGRNIELGEVLQYKVKKGSIFGSMMKNEGFALVGCLVSPAFSYEHFELFTKKELMELYPQFSELYDTLAIND